MHQSTVLVGASWRFELASFYFRRDSGQTGCSADEDCQSYFFCKRFSYVCTPCTSCVTGSETASGGCSARCNAGRELNSSIPKELLISIAVVGALLVRIAH